MKNYENVVCPKCGTVAIKGTKKCVKCHTYLENDKKSCPKCAKINDIKAQKCISCGYNFNRKPRSLTFNIIVSVLLVISLFILVALEYNGVVQKINIVFKIIAILFILFLIHTNVNYGYKDIIKYDAHEEINAEMSQKLKRMKKISSILIIIAGILILLSLLLYYLSRR